MAFGVVNEIRWVKMKDFLCCLLVDIRFILKNKTNPQWTHFNLIKIVDFFSSKWHWDHVHE